MRYLLLLTALACGPLFANPLECRHWFAGQQAALDAAGIHDAGSVRVPGHPHLRVDRWLVMLHGEALGDARQQLWLELAGEQAREGWQAELSRLDPGGDWQDRLEPCLTALASVSTFHAVGEVAVADSHARWQRVIGLYPLTRLVARPGLQRQRRLREARLQRPARPPLRHYVPAPFSGNMPVLASLPVNAFDLPRPRGPGRQALLAHYAPVLSVSDPRDINQPGRVVMAAGQPRVDTDQPRGYQWTSWTRFRGHNLLQLNYQFWFPRRPPQGRLDPRSGELDSLIWRVTLKPDGNVLYYDSLRGDGSDHTIFPVAGGLRPRLQGASAPVYARRPAPNAAAGRVNLQLEPGSHALVRVEPFQPDSDIRHYLLSDADALQHLADDQGGVTSLYDARGLVPASRRRPSPLHWSLGMRAAGTLRQPGHHALDPLGRRHFDDPRLPAALFVE